MEPASEISVYKPLKLKAEKTAISLRPCPALKGIKTVKRPISLLSATTLRPCPALKGIKTVSYPSLIPA